MCVPFEADASISIHWRVTRQLDAASRPTVSGIVSSAMHGYCAVLAYHGPDSTCYTSTKTHYNTRIIVLGRS